MTRAEARAFADQMAALAKVFDAQPDKTRTELYFRALQDLPLAAVQHAVGAAIQGCRFFPKPAELRELVGAGVADQAELAWAGLLDGFRSGRWAEPDPITAALIRVYWGDLSEAHRWWCYCPDVELHTKHKDFVRLYVLYAQKPESELPRLPGRPVPALEAGRKTVTDG